MTTMETEDKLARARSQAEAQCERIVEMVDKLRVAADDDAYEAGAKGLAEAAGYVIRPNGDGRFIWAKDLVEGDTPRDTEDEAWLACCDENGLRPDADEAREAIQEDALSVQVRSGWHAPGEASEPEEFEILLCTGGPAVRIVGELDEHNEPSRARIECQDWFTPWAEVFGAIEQEALLEYARCFYFGE